MIIKLWTTHFVRICLANMLLFISVYMLFPVLPVEMADRLGVPVAQTGCMFLFFTLGMFIIGPFHAYLIDAYKRKLVYIYSFGFLLVASVGLMFITSTTQLLLLSICQGMAFGLATTAGITLGIDVTGTTFRSAGNVSFAWMARLGMIIGIALGVWFNQYYSFKDLITISLIIGSLGVLIAVGIYVPFRAPIVTGLFSFDRFLLIRGWVPALNIILITFIPGLLIPTVYPYLNDFRLGETGITIPFFAVAGVGYLFSLLLHRFFFSKDKILLMTFAGIVIELMAVCFLNAGHTVIIPSLLLGIGLGLVMPQFLLMLVKLSHHCQRGTANTTHLLAIETGISLGIAYACSTSAMDKTLDVSRNVALAALVCFVLINYPYYKKMKIR